MLRDETMNDQKTLRSARTLLPILGIASLGLVACVSGCNTVEGVGEDIKSASVSTKEAINDATGSKSTDNKGSVEGQGSSTTKK